MEKATDIRMVTYGRLSKEFHQYVNEKYPNLTIELAKSKGELIKALKTSNCYAGFNALKGLDISGLRWIHAFGAGVDSFLNDPAIAGAEVHISRSFGKMGELMGEYCVAHILSILQNLSEYVVLQKKRNWEQKPTSALRTKKVLILGTGTIGQGVAEKLKPFGCELLGASRSGTPHSIFNKTIKMSALSKSVASVDICINCLPLTPKTNGLIDEEFLEPFKNTIFINVGRGKAFLSEQVILQALDKGQLLKAVLDVFPEEPLPKKSQLWAHPNVVITPHVSGISTLEDVKIGFEEALEAYLEGNSTPFVDKERGY